MFWWRIFQIWIETLDVFVKVFYSTSILLCHANNTSMTSCFGIAFHALSGGCKTVQTLFSCSLALIRQSCLVFVSSIVYINSSKYSSSSSAHVADCHSVLCSKTAVSGVFLCTLRYWLLCKRCLYFLFFTDWRRERSQRKHCCETNQSLLGLWALITWLINICGMLDIYSNER